MKRIADRHSDVRKRKKVVRTPRAKRAAKAKLKRNDRRAREVALGMQVVDIEELKKSHAQALAGEGRTIDEILADVHDQANTQGRTKSILHKS